MRRLSIMNTLHFETVSKATWSPSFRKKAVILRHSFYILFVVWLTSKFSSDTSELSLKCDTGT